MHACWLALLAPSCVQGAAKRRWFNMHRGIQSLGLASCLASLVLALCMVANSRGTHFSCLHSKLGLLVTVAGLLQPVNALMRPHPQPRSWGRKVGLTWFD